MTTIVVNGKRLQLTTDDYTWALRSVLGEGGAGRATDTKRTEWAGILYTMLHRWAGNYGKANESFGAYIQRFSQPVNPNQIGKIHAYDKTADDPTGINHSQARDARIRNFRSMSATEIETRYPEMAALVRSFFAGKVDRTPFERFADFAAGYAGSGSEDTLVYRGEGNVFYAEPWVTRMQFMFENSPISKPPYVLYTTLSIGALVGVVAWYYLRKRA